MCGIAGVVGPDVRNAARASGLIECLRHRGPDEQATYLFEGGAVASARLAQIAMHDGSQPWVDSPGDVVVAFNGEVYNHASLRKELASGHDFSTRAEVEVIGAAYRRWGIRCFERFEGQYAIAVADLRSRTVHLTRDRWGICPLYFSLARGTLWFASEPRPICDALGLDVNYSAICELSEMWGLRPGSTLFRGLDEAHPGEVVSFTGGSISRTGARNPFEPLEDGCDRVTTDALAAALRKSVTECTQSDSTVGACVSGGLDSSVLAFLAAEAGVSDFFSIGFDDPGLDESEQQLAVVAALPRSVRHHRTTITGDDIASDLVDTVAAVDSPMLRLSPVATRRLSELVHAAGIKAVISGEGADELFLGYDIFREVRVRAAWAHRKDSTLLPQLARSLVGGRAGRSYPALMRAHLDDDGTFGYGHEMRRSQHRRRRSLFTSDFLETFGDAVDLSGRPTLPTGPVRRTQIVEMSYFLTGYLLSTQGDRPFMSHAVEPRFPYLNSDVARIAGRLPPYLGARLHDEKLPLRRVADTLMPGRLAHRPKFAYQAPVASPLRTKAGRELLACFCNEREVARNGIFDPAAVSCLKARVMSGDRGGLTDGMSLVLVLTTQIWLATHRRPIARAA